MNNKYYNRYDLFSRDGEFKMVPGIELPIKSTDKFIVFRKGRDRFDKYSQEYYGTPFFGWLIMLANPNYDSIEFNIPDESVIRIPYPLVSSLQDYKKMINLYELYYGQ